MIVFLTVLMFHLYIFSLSRDFYFSMYNPRKHGIYGVLFYVWTTWAIIELIVDIIK